MDEAKSRLERARFQYENILMQAGNALLTTDMSPKKSFHGSSYEEAYLTEESSPHFNINSSALSFNQSRFISPIKETKDLATEIIENNRDNLNLSAKDKTEIILSLQDENERLRQKLKTAIDTAQQVIKDAQDTNEELVYDYEHRISKLEEKNSMLEEENKQLRIQLEKTQTERDFEKENLYKSLRIIDKFKKRNKEYVETQKKCHQILSSMDGIHYSFYANPASKESIVHVEQELAQSQMAGANKRKKDYHRTSVSNHD